MLLSLVIYLYAPISACKEFASGGNQTSDLEIPCQEPGGLAEAIPPRALCQEPGGLAEAMPLGHYVRSRVGWRKQCPRRELCQESGGLVEAMPRGHYVRSRVGWRKQSPVGIMSGAGWAGGSNAPVSKSGA
jgi:hypothetical protein